MNLGEHSTSIYKVESYLYEWYFHFMLNWCHDNATSLRQKGTNTKTKLRQKEQN